ncbi:hypothetical protein [Spirosoma validum]|uniref:Uncharacterized protein n=1 Tax=Spirosoma validum TaxID=2771355 RepID=A0A927B1Y3_9BACT|nr:hypothetical protein [Spirosoma validum]MBD2753747.1 hypothetical protein [Spirosoma validum]
MNPQSKPSEIDLKGPGIRKIMKESAYQLVEELEAFLRDNEYRYQVYTTFTDVQFEHVRSLPPIHDSVRTGFNEAFDPWYQTLATYFAHYADTKHTNVAQFGSLHEEARTMSHEEAVKIVKARIGWLLINADELED